MVNMKKSLWTASYSLRARLFTQEKSLLQVVNVGNSLGTNITSLNNGEITLEKDPIT
jgi:hypothetical protein